MSSAFICTQGTSIANGSGAESSNLAKLQRELQKRQDSWDSQHPEFERELDIKLTALSLEDLAHASAELDILSKQGIRSDDRVVLLCSDGYLGRVCGEWNKRLIVKVFGLEDSDVEFIRIPDLQVKDGQRLSKFGLKNFIDFARKAIEKYNGLYTVYLCPNGGYKGVVPFLTLLGMQYHCNVLYTFEFSDSVVTLPPLPYVFDRELYLRARRALAMLTEKVEMREEEYLANIDYYEDGERDFFLGFVQYTRPGYVTPSPLIDSFVNESMAMDAMLSKQAVQDIESEKNGNLYYGFCRMIMNSQDVIWRKKNLHTVHETDLLIIKPHHSTMRLLGFMVGQRYYVARVLQHDVYEQALKTLSKNDFPLEVFSPWRPPEELKDVGDNLSTSAELLEKNDALKADNDRLLQENLDLENELEEQKKVNEQAAKALAVAERTLRTTCEEKDAIISELSEKLEVTEALNNRPWYKKIFG